MPLTTNTEEKIINALQTMAKSDNKPSEMLRYLVLDLKIEQQLELMLLFTKAFNVTLGEVTAISGWWHDSTAELNDNDINAYISPVIANSRKGINL
jgi:hypothetical protein